MKGFFLKKKNGVRLFVTVSKSKGQPIGTVLLCHGLGLNSTSPLMQTIRRCLVGQNYSCVLFDMSGHGKSTGSIATRSVSHFVSDIRTVSTWIRNNEEFKKLPRYIVGHSIGALSALIYSSRDRVVAGLCLIGCNSNAKALYERYQSMDRVHRYKKYTKLGDVKVATNFVRQRAYYEPKKYIKRIAAAKLILVGSRDHINPPADSRQLYTWSRSPKEFDLVSGVEHSPKNKADQEKVAKRIISWLKRIRK